MTPKEKAHELTQKITDSLINSGARIGKVSVIQCALICVEEIIKVTHSDKRANSPLDKEWWHKVKTEIEKL